ncbi:MAG TPA: FtsK/SpoIIIE domain-containing protein [Solirubrobacteraceae bacterium]|nr:FtsK/SpoIIIE domain-containing protein [Solirubrobacteraceae bacterium]
MHVVLDNPDGGASDLELQVGREDATVGDLLDALPGGDGARGVVIDGRFFHVDLALAEIGLYEGARITAADAAPRAADERLGPALELRVIAGFDAGRTVPLRGRGIEAGRDPECDLVLTDEGVSRRHLRVVPSQGGLRATVTDLDSVNGTWVEGRRIRAATDVEPGEIFEAGDVAFMVAAPAMPLVVDPVRQANLAGTIAFNRPPRPRLGLEAAPITAPEAPGRPQKAHFSMASAIGPLLMGGVMVVLLHSILYALFMLLSPILVIGSYIEQRRNNKRNSRGEQREFQHAMDVFRREVVDRQRHELRRRREAHPDQADITRRAQAPDPRLWERRPSDDDFLALTAGYGELPFRPVLTHSMTPAEQAEAVLAEHSTLELAPVPVALGEGGVVGIVGEREQAIALARALVCQAAVLHGPADLMIAVFTEEPARGEWDWVKWLPHTRDAAGGSERLVAVGVKDGTALGAELTEHDPEEDERRILAVLDSPGLIEGRGAAGRGLLRAGPHISGIVIARSSERLPAACTTVIELADEAGEARASRPQLGERVDPVLICGVSRETARATAVALARFEDADLKLAGGALPDHVSLAALLGLGEVDAAELQGRWRRTEHGSALMATFALSEEGPLAVDLVADGPHGLIAGTTGAGKSELLRSLVASLAAEHSPARVNFVLVDYKGGSAFAECAELPHTVGMVTDLDEHLGERALLSLEAELRFRERVLREHRTSDIIEHDRLVAEGRVPPLPRLMVIIDEFATLAAELPDFVPSLVGIAQRGRSLGVHMILATQRPSGAVNENIRANTNLRICLRVQTPQDSSDVVDSPAAAKIPRKQPGRAQIRLGPSELIPVQTALVTAATATAATAPVALTPFTLVPPPAAPGPAADGSAPARSDLQRLVGAANDAFTAGPAPRRPWLPPLPSEVGLDDLLSLGPGRGIAGDRGLVVPFALADDPEAQAQYPVGWNLGAGNLVLYGIGGSGTTTALTTIALSLAQMYRPDRLHMYAMDFGASELGSLAGLPHVGAVIGAGEHERQRRLLQRLRAEIVARRQLDPAARVGLPLIVLILDGYGGFVSEHSDLSGDELREAMARVWAEGPELGVHCVITADRLGSVPTALASLAQQRLAFQLADVADFAQFGVLRKSIPQFVPGRAILSGSIQVVQVARDPRPLAEAVAARAGEPATHGGPPPVRTLPETVEVGSLLEGGRDTRDPLFIPIGIGSESLQPAGFELYEGDHAMIAGPPRSGRTTALLVVAQVLSELYPELELIGMAMRRSPLRDCPELARVVTSLDELPDLARELRTAEPMKILLVDDADGIDDPTRALSDLFQGPVPSLHAIVAGRIDALKQLGHWSVGVRRARVGMLLNPDVAMDGSLLGATLPRRPVPPVRPGCGFRVDAGGFELVQVAQARLAPERAG